MLRGYDRGWGWTTVYCENEEAYAELVNLLTKSKYAYDVECLDACDDDWFDPPTPPEDSDGDN